MQILHIAGHAVVEERPGRSTALLLAPDDLHDGLLEPREIAALELRTDLTVLAACRTAGGESGGSALSTIAGSFLAAGTSAVVATLWDIGDQATAAFMDQFYYQLGHGARPAAALREAKRRLRQDPDWSSPHLWAGYVLIGDAPPLTVRRSLAPGPAVILVLVLGLVLLGLLRSRSRRHTDSPSRPADP